MPKPPRFWPTLLLIFMGWATPALADLHDYVQRPEPAYDYEVVDSQPLGSARVMTLRMTSQTWQGKPWRHWMGVLLPREVRHPGQAILVIVGGRNGKPRPKLPDEARLIAGLANRLGVVIAVVAQVPNQPLLDGLREDGLIAETFDRYLRGEGDRWPLLLPMVKSATAAMDTVDAVVAKQTGTGVDHFIVTGASKRGWTTWLTAAADPRVKGIAPMVIDMLDLGAQMRQQRAVFGEDYSPMIRPYTDLHVIDRLHSAAGRDLLKIVDPFSYRAALTMPKLVVLGTNDPYWTITSANLYFPKLPGEKGLYYATNAGHGLNLGVIPTLTAFLAHTLRDQPMPDLHWESLDAGGLRVQWEQPGATAVLWQATSPTPDFRRAQWTPTPLEGEWQVRVHPSLPDDGFLAYHVRVTFPGDEEAPAFGLSTTMTLLGPDGPVDLADSSAAMPATADPSE